MCMCGATDCAPCTAAQGYEMPVDWASEMSHFGIEDLRQSIATLKQALDAAEKGEFKTADAHVTDAVELLQGVGL